MAHLVDIEVGRRIRERRCLLGLTQRELGMLVGVRFQQIQKYERGLNRVSASRLWEIALALDVPVEHFFWQQCTSDAAPPDFKHARVTGLVSYFLTLPEQQRRTLLQLASAMARARVD